MPTEERLLEKLRKLLALQEGAAAIGSQAEAAVAASKVAEFLARHKIEMSEVLFSQRNEIDPIGSEIVESILGHKKSRCAWQENLATVIGKYHFCKILVYPGKNTLLFVGRRSDREIAVWLYSMLSETCERLAKAEYNRVYYLMKSQGVDTSLLKGFLPSFRTAFIDAIHERLQAQKESLSSSGVSLVRLSTAWQEVADFLSRMKVMRVSSVRGHSQEGVGSSLGRQQGYSAGRSVSLNRPLSQGSNPRLGASR